MSKRMILRLVVCFLLAGVTWWLFQRYTPPGERPPVIALSATPSQSPKVASGVKVERLAIDVKALKNPPPIIPRALSTGYPLWRGGRAINLQDPRWKIWKERQKSDPDWQGKMAIEFYGKVVDEKEQPISDASVEFIWTDLSRQGTSKQNTKSDADGLFDLRGVIGKNLRVKIAKEGYEISRTQNRFGFEYATFADEQYYEPDPDKPVLFHFRKKGKAEPLIYHEEKIKVTVGQPLTIPIDGATHLRFILRSNVDPDRGKWEAELGVQDGGIVPATGEFIVEAPATGYQTTMIIGPQTPKPPRWVLYQGGSFYLKIGDNYGRLDIEMIPEKDWLRIKTWINPKSGSRNVELDPKSEASSR